MPSIKIVTPLGDMFSGECEKLLVRTTEGDVCILNNHIDYIASLGNGKLKIINNSDIKEGIAVGGFISVNNNQINVIANSFSWN